MTTPALEVHELRTYFHTDDGIVKAVDGISYQVAPGEILGIVGESGSGKTVANLSVMGLIPQPPGDIVTGEIRVGGEDILAMGPEAIRKIRGRRVAMIFQDPMTSLNPFLRISRQMTEGMEVHMGLSPEQSRARAIELLERVGIPGAAERIDSYPHEFSGGMRQRVMIAMAIACDPEILIADEPTTALDVTIQAQILELLKSLRDELGMAIVLITHDLGVVAGMADRINVMYGGRIIESGAVDAIFSDPRHPYTRGLLASIPRLDKEGDQHLEPIPGTPPDLVATGDFCAFYPRCSEVMDHCKLEAPPLETLTDGGCVRCWLYSDIPDPKTKEGSDVD